MSALRFLPSLASARGIGFPRSPLRLICKGRPSLYLQIKGHGAQVASQSFHNTAIRYISQANRDKVIERNEAIKRDSTIDVRVKKIISEQLGVKAVEVCALYYFRDAGQQLSCYRGFVDAEVGKIHSLTLPFTRL
jgi:hypothetical protein